MLKLYKCKNFTTLDTDRKTLTRFFSWNSKRHTSSEAFEVMKTTSCNFHVKAPKIVATAQLT